MKQVALAMTIAFAAFAGAMGSSSASAQLLQGNQPMTSPLDDSGVHRCRAMVEFKLRELGLRMDELTSFRWGNYYFNNGYSYEIAGFRFYGMPKSCTSGSVQLNMWANCDIMSVRTRGGCEVPGVP